MRFGNIFSDAMESGQKETKIYTVHDQKKMRTCTVDTNKMCSLRPTFPYKRTNERVPLWRFYTFQ